VEYVEAQILERDGGARTAPAGRSCVRRAAAGRFLELLLPVRHARGHGASLAGPGPDRGHAIAGDGTGRDQATSSRRGGERPPAIRAAPPWPWAVGVRPGRRGAGGSTSLAAAEVNY